MTHWITDRISSFKTLVGQANSSPSRREEYERDYYPKDYYPRDSREATRSKVTHIDERRTGPAERRQPSMESQTPPLPLPGDFETPVTVWSGENPEDAMDISSGGRAGRESDMRSRHSHDVHRERERPHRTATARDLESDLLRKCRKLTKKTEEAERRLEEVEDWYKKRLRAASQEIESLHVIREDFERQAKETRKAYDSQVRELEDRLETVSRELNTAHRGMNEADAHFHRQREEIQVYKAEVQRAEAQHDVTRKVLEEKVVELRGAQAFLSHADSLSGADVIALVNSLNAEILQGAAFMADTLGPGGEIHLKDETKVLGYVRRLIGGELTDALVSLRTAQDKDDYDPTLMQLAMQACLTRCCWKLGWRWALGGTADDWANKVYASIQQQESQPVAGRWRAMTRANSQEIKDPSHWTRYAMTQLSYTLLVAGFPGLEAQGPLTKFEERLSVIINLALRLQNAVGEEITSMDLEPFIISPRTPFNAIWMEDTYAGGGDSDVAGEPILATTELGLKQTENGSARVLVKPKVILRSALETGT